MKEKETKLYLNEWMFVCLFVYLFIYLFIYFFNRRRKTTAAAARSTVDQHPAFERRFRLHVAPLYRLPARRGLGQCQHFTSLLPLSFLLPLRMFREPRGKELKKWETDSSLPFFFPPALLFPRKRGVFFSFWTVCLHRWPMCWFFGPSSSSLGFFGLGFLLYL